MPLEEITTELLRTGRWEGELIHTKKDGMSDVIVLLESWRRGAVRMEKGGSRRQDISPTYGREGQPRHIRRERIVLTRWRGIRSDARTALAHHIAED
jgi:hypothetical protein